MNTTESFSNQCTMKGHLHECNYVLCPLWVMPGEYYRRFGKCRFRRFKHTQPSSNP